MRKKQLPEERCKVKIGNNLSTQTQFIDLHQGHQIIYRPSHSESKSDTRPKIDIEIEENSPHQEGIILEVYQRPDNSYFQEPKDLESLINTHNLVQKFL